MALYLLDTTALIAHALGDRTVLDLIVTEPLRIQIDGRSTADEAVVLGDEVLVGPTVLEKLDLNVDCANRRLVPNPEHPDQPVIKIK